MIDSLLLGEGARVAKHAANSVSQTFGLGCCSRGVTDHQQLVRGNILERPKSRGWWNRRQIDGGHLRASRRILSGGQRNGSASGRRDPFAEGYARHYQPRIATRQYESHIAGAEIW